MKALRADRGFAALVVIIVGLGIGACVTVFSVTDALLLRPLPFSEPQELVWISNGQWERGDRLSGISVQVAYLNEMRSAATLLDDVAGYHLFDGDGDHSMILGGEPTRVTRLRVTSNLFAVLGIAPAHGRFFTDDEALDDGPAAVVLTAAFFSRAFASDPAIVGKAVIIDGDPFTVVGVLPPSFDFTAIFSPGRRVDYLAPFPLSERSNREGNTLGLIGRLAPGATTGAAAAEARALATQLQGERLNGFTPVLTPLHDHVSGSFKASVFVLVGSAALVMLIVCANLSNLLLARGATKDREMAIRAAIGAPRRRLIRQLLAESMLLSMVGSLLGLLLAWITIRMLATLNLQVPLLSQARVDGPAFLIAMATALIVGVIFGVIPAFRCTAKRLHESLNESARGASHGPRVGVGRHLLVVSEVTLACVLLVVSTLLVRSLLEVLRVDLGYRPSSAVAMRIDPPRRFQTNEERVAFYGQVLDRARALPGAEAVGLTDVLPMGFNRTWSVEDLAAPAELILYPYVRVVSDGYLDAMGLQLRAGRDLGPTDDPVGERVALVNERLAVELWPGRDPLGRVVRASGQDYTVIGVVRDTRQLSVEQAAGPEIYFSIRQLGDQSAVHLILRSADSAAGLVAAARRSLHAMDPALPLDQVIGLQDVVDASIAPRRFLVGLLSTFAALALILASLGIYGVVSYGVVQRRREIGIRIALGASAGGVQWRIVKQSLAFTAIGLTLGLVIAAASGRLLASLLFHVAPMDPITYLSVATLLGIVATMSGYVPARRASRANPLVSLSETSTRPSARSSVGS